MKTLINKNSIYDFAATYRFDGDNIIGRRESNDTEFIAAKNVRYDEQTYRYVADRGDKPTPFVKEILRVMPKDYEAKEDWNEKLIWNSRRETLQSLSDYQRWCAELTDFDYDCNCP